MKVKTIVQNGLAISPRKNVYFEKGDILGIGDKGLSEENLKTLVEIGFAKKVGGQPVAKIVTIPEPNDEDPTDEAEESMPTYKTFTKKSDLEDYAEEFHGISLDRRKTLAGMVKQLENELEGDN